MKYDIDILGFSYFEYVERLRLWLPAQCTYCIEWRWHPCVSLTTQKTVICWSELAQLGTNMSY